MIGFHLTCFLFVFLASKGAAGATGAGLVTLAGNSIATLLVGQWTGGLDKQRLDQLIDALHPFDESDMVDDEHEVERASPAGPSSPPRQHRPA